MPTVHDFLSRGFFPKELPPLFDTSRFADHMIGNPTHDDAPKWVDLLHHSHSKYASVRRTLSIPNPHHYYHLSKGLVDSWPGLQTILSGSTLSRTKPIVSADRAVEGEKKFLDLPIERATHRASGRYLFKADIASFYPSIYTHSIPWAIHGKTISKNNHAWKGDNMLWGNYIDKWLQVQQSGQTVGIPIGPDTSFVIAETLLCAIDKCIEEKLKNTVGFRFVDDYEFICETLPDAERMLAVLQDALAEYELKLNAPKTQIIELPTDLDTNWTRELSQATFSDNPDLLRVQLTRFFTDAFRLVRAYPGGPVLKYSVRRIAEVNIPDSVKPLVHSLLLQSAVTDSGTLMAALEIFYRDLQGGFSLDTKQLSRSLNAITVRHAPLGHGSEVAWSILAAAVFNARLSQVSADAIAAMSDDVVALTALACEGDSFDVGVQLDKSNWQGLISSKGLHGPHWLLNYEGVGQGWLVAPEGQDPALNDSYFYGLRKGSISFLDLQLAGTFPEALSLGRYPG